MDKDQAVAAVIAQLEQSYQRMLASARSTERAATDAENRSEGKYDTRGLETSYLAAGQGEQVEELAAALQSLQAEHSFPDFDPGDAIDAGALVEADFGDEHDFFLLAPAAGGVVVEVDDAELTVLAPGAPLREKLMGLGEGEQLDDPPLRIVSVR